MYVTAVTRVQNQTIMLVMKRPRLANVKPTKAHHTTQLTVIAKTMAALYVILKTASRIVASRTTFCQTVKAKLFKSQAAAICRSQGWKPALLFVLRGCTIIPATVWLLTTPTTLCVHVFSQPNPHSRALPLLIYALPRQPAVTRPTFAPAPLCQIMPVWHWPGKQWREWSKTEILLVRS